MAKAPERMKEGIIVIECPLSGLGHQNGSRTMTMMLVAVVRVLSQRLRQTNALVGDVARLSEFLQGSLV
jgi:hypothetical protein